MAKDPYRYFRIEARELLDTLSRGILDLETRRVDNASKQDVEPLLRASHTLKGAAGVVGQEAIATLAHRLEGQVASFGSHEASGAVTIRSLLDAVDAIAVELSHLGGPPPTGRGGAYATAPSEEVESVRLDLHDVDALLNSLAELNGRLASTRARADASSRQLETMARDVGARLEGRKRTPSSVEWDDVIEVFQPLLRDLHAQRGEHVALLEGAERLARDALDQTRRLRLLPASMLFTELGRAARDAATKTGRRVELESGGAEIRLDAHVLRLLRDALLQLVRNAVAHAIEPPAERVTAGKPEVGRISIRFELRGARALVTFRDDGRGLDVEAIRTALVARELVTSADARAMSLNALIRTAMRRGVTTSTAATELAGRGVGLQVVGAAIERLRGRIDVRSIAGHGTEFELEVPVSMTAAPALVVETGEVTATIPLDAVTRTVRFAANDVTRSPTGDAVSDEGEVLRFGSLAQLLGMPSDVPERPGALTAILLASQQTRVAVGVDRVLGIANDVVLSLPSPIAADALVVGASLDGQGNPRLALDPELLVESIVRLPGTPRGTVPPEKKAILVVDDSVTSRMLERSILEAAGYDVTTAASAEEALELVKGKTYALFVVDVEMPGMSGFAFVARTRADPVLSSTPAVLVTSRATSEDRRRGLEAGARGYIVKGEFAQDEFLDAVRRLVR